MPSVLEVGPVVRRPDGSGGIIYTAILPGGLIVTSPDMYPDDTTDPEVYEAIRRGRGI